MTDTRGTKLMSTFEHSQENSWCVLRAITGRRADQWRASNAQVRLTGGGVGSVSDTDRRNVSAEMELPLRAAVAEMPGD